jgi:ankyrin repeat protein
LPIDGSTLELFAKSKMGPAVALAQGFASEINVPLDASGITPLMYFCIRCIGPYTKPIEKNQKLQLLLEMGANVNPDRSNSLGVTTTLMWAVRNQPGCDFLELLLDAGADVNLADFHGRTALFMAAESRQTEVMKLLIKRGASIQHVSRNRETILKEELRRTKPNLEVIRIMVESGANTEVTQDLISSLRAKKLSPQIFQLLLEACPATETKDSNGNTPLAIAASNESCQIAQLEFLLKAGAYIDASNRVGQTPLMLAAANGHASAVKYLLEHKANANHCDQFGFTPLLRAVSSGNTQAVAYLLDHGASVHQIANNGLGALHICCEEGHSSIVPLLVDAGVDINLSERIGIEQAHPQSTHEDGRTPLMFSVQSERVTSALLKYSPDVNMLDRHHKSALMYVKDNWEPAQRENIVKLLLKRDARVNIEDVDGNTALHIFAECGPAPAVSHLLDAQANVDARNAQDETPLMLCNDQETMQLLIGCGASLNLVDKKGKSALIRQCSHTADYGTISALVKAGCDLDIQDLSGKTALMYLAQKDDNHRVLRLLVQRGANLDLKDLEGHSATARADSNNLLFLIESGAKPCTGEDSRLEISIRDDNLPLSLALLRRGSTIRLNLAQFIQCKRTLKRLASADFENLQKGALCVEPEAKEQLEKLLEQSRGSKDTASDEELPYILRKGASPIKVEARKAKILSVERLNEINQVLNVKKCRIDWPKGLKEAVLLEYAANSRPYKQTKIKKQSTDRVSPNLGDHLLGLLQKKGDLSFSSLFTGLPVEGDRQIAEFWNENSAAICKKNDASYHRCLIGVMDLHYLLARFGPEALPGILGSKIKTATLAEALRFVDSPACARLMSDALNSSSCKTTARQWVLKYPESCITGIISDAISKLGKRRTSAEICLRFLASNGHKSVIHQTASQLGSDVRDSVVEILSQDHRYDFLALKPPEFPEFWSADVLPRPRLKSNEKELPTSAVDAIAGLMSVSNMEFQTPELTQVLQSCDRKSLASFVWAAFVEWAEKGNKNSEWIFEALAYFGDDACARKLATYIRNWPSRGGIVKSYKGLEILAEIGTDVALAQIQSISQKNKNQLVLERAKETLQTIAAARGLDLAELEERLVPDCGLSEAGVIELSYGGRHFIGTVDAALNPVLRDAGGEILKMLPKAQAGDDEAISKQSKTAWAECTREIKSTAKMQLQRLELAMVQSRRWPGLNFNSALVRSPLLQNVVRGLIWGFFSQDGNLKTTFMVEPNGAFRDVAGNILAITDESIIGIVHPVLMGERLLAEWQQLFTSNRQIQPFAQLVRKTYRRSDDSQNDLFGLDGSTLASGAFSGLSVMGWSANVDGGLITKFERSLPSGHVTVSLDPCIVVGDARLSGESHLIEISMSDQLSALDFSEAIRELMTIKK